MIVLVATVLGVAVLAGVLLWLMETPAPAHGVCSVPGVPPPSGCDGASPPPDYDG